MKRQNISKFFLCISLFSTSLIMGMGSEPLLGEEMAPQHRVPKNYYDLLGLKKELDATTKAAFDSLEEQSDFKILTDNIASLNRDLEGFEADLKKVESRLEENKGIPQEIERIRADGSIAESIAWNMILPLRQKLEEDQQLHVSKKELTEKIKKYQLKLEELERERQKLRQSVISNMLERDITKDVIAGKCKEKREELQKKREQLERVLQGERLTFEVRAKKQRDLADVQYEIEQTAHACPLLLNDKRRQAYDVNLAALHEESKGLIDSLRKGIRKVLDDPPDLFINVNNLAGDLLVDKLNPILQDLFGDAPMAMTKLFNQEIALRSIEFLPKPSGEDVRYWVGFSGLMQLNRFDVRVSIYMVQDIYGIRRVSCFVELPDYYKLSDLIPGFTYLDTFSFPKMRLIFSNFSYFDQVPIRRGVTLLAEVDLSGPFNILSDLKERSKYTKSLVFENKPVVLSGYLPKGIFKNYLDARFDVYVPFHFGFDFRQMSLMPKSVSNVINQITTDDLRLTIAPRETKREAEEREEYVKAVEKTRTLKKTTLAERAGEKLKPSPPVLQEFTREKVEPTVRKLTNFARFNIEAEVGARIVLGTQKTPLRLTLLGAIKPSWNLANSSLLFAANMKNMLQLKWLAIGDASVQFIWDTALMAAAAAIGLPFTGFGLRGRIDLGKPGASRAHLNAAGGFNVSTSEVPDLLFNLRGTNIRFADLLNYISYLATRARILKQPFPVGKIPTMTFKHVEGYASLANMTIGKEFYPAGLGLQVEMELFKKKFGLKVDMSNEFRLSGFGYMPRIDATIKGHELFKLYDSTIPDRGPQVGFAFDPQKPLEGYCDLSGAFEIPAIRLKEDVKFRWWGWILDTEFESTFAGIAILFGARINLRPKAPAPAVGAVAVPEAEEQEREDGGRDIVKKLPERLAEIKKVEPKWQQMYVRFGFKQEFAEYMSKVAKPLFQKMYAAASKKLKVALDTMLELKARGVKGFEAEIERARRSVAQTEEQLKQAREVCATSRWYKKYKCAQIGAFKSVLLSKKSYLNGLLRPTKAIAKGAAKVSVAVVQKTAVIQEIALEVATGALELIKEGVSLFTLKEFLGEISAQDIAQGKLGTLKRLVMEVNITGKPQIISLYEVPFDLRYPYRAIERVAEQVLRTFLGKNLEYIERIRHITD